MRRSKARWIVMIALAVVSLLTTHGCGSWDDGDAESSLQASWAAKAVTVTGADQLAPADWFSIEETVHATNPDQAGVLLAFFEFPGTNCGDGGIVTGVKNGNTWTADCNLSGISGQYPSSPGIYNNSWRVLVTSCFNLPSCTQHLSSFSSYLKINTTTAPRISAAGIHYLGGSGPYPSGCDAANKRNCYYREFDGSMEVRWYPYEDGNTDAKIATITSVGIDFSGFGFGLASASFDAANHFFVAARPIPSGMDRGGEITVTVAYGSGSTTSANKSWQVDQQSIAVTARNIIVTGATGTGGAFRGGDTFFVTWDDSVTGDNNNDNYYQKCADFSSLGGPSCADMTESPVDSRKWSASYALPEGGFVDGTYPIRIRIRDDANHPETRSYRVSDGPAAASNPQVLSCVEACAQLFGGAAADFNCSTLTNPTNRKAFLSGYGDSQYCVGSGLDDTFKFPVSGGPYNCGSLGCSYSAWVNDLCANSVNHCQDARAVIEKEVDADNRLPILATVTVSGGTGTGGALRYGDRLTLRWDAIADETPDADHAVAELDAALGGPLYLTDPQHQIFVGQTAPLTAPIEKNDYAFYMHAYDDVGNEVWHWMTLPVVIDTIVPSGATQDIEFIDAPLVYKVGDEVTVRWTNDPLRNADLVSVAIDFGSAGLGRVTAANVPGTDTWEATAVVSEGCTVASSFSVTVLPRDDAGNEGQIVSGPRALDAVSPRILSSSIRVSGASSADGRVRNGDTLLVTWDAAADGNDDVSDVTVSFASLGGPAAQVASREGDVWQASWSVASSESAGLKAVGLTARDAAGNTTTRDSAAFSFDDQPEQTDDGGDTDGADGTDGGPDPDGADAQAGDTVPDDAGGGDADGGSVSDGAEAQACDTMPDDAGGGDADSGSVSDGADAQTGDAVADDDEHGHPGGGTSGCGCDTGDPMGSSFGFLAVLFVGIVRRRSFQS